jgi:hypothetical protein
MMNNVALSFWVARVFVLLYVIMTLAFVLLSYRRRNKRILKEKKLKETQREAQELSSVSSSTQHRALLLYSEQREGNELGSWDPSLIVDVHFLISLVLSLGGFWWKRLPYFPKKTARLTQSCVLVIILFVSIQLCIAVYLLGDNSGDNNWATILVNVVGLAVFTGIMLMAWSSFQYVGSFLHTPSPVLSATDVKRQYRRVTVQLIVQMLCTFIIPTVIDAIFHNIGMSFVFRFYPACCLVVIAFVGEYCGLMAEAFAADAFDLYFGKEGSMCKSIQECVFKYERFETVVNNCSAAFSFIAFPALFWAISELTWAIAGAFIARKSDLYKIISSTVLLASICVGFISPASANSRLTQFRTILHLMIRKSLREEDIVVYCPNDISSRSASLGIQPLSREEHVLSAMSDIKQNEGWKRGEDHPDDVVDHCKMSEEEKKLIGRTLRLGDAHPTFLMVFGVEAFSVQLQPPLPSSYRFNRVVTGL